MKSEFGKGFIYNLFLFAKHHDRDLVEMNGKKDYGLWFDGAADHFIELQIPKQYKGTEIGNLALWIKTTGTEYRLSFGHITDEQFTEFFNKCEELMILIDKDFYLKPIKATWN